MCVPLQWRLREKDSDGNSHKHVGTFRADVFVTNVTFHSDLDRRFGARGVATLDANMAVLIDGVTSAL